MNACLLVSEIMCCPLLHTPRSSDIKHFFPLDIKKQWLHKTLFIKRECEEPEFTWVTGELGLRRSWLRARWVTLKILINKIKMYIILHFFSNTHNMLFYFRCEKNDINLMLFFFSPDISGSASCNVGDF